MTLGINLLDTVVLEGQQPNSRSQAICRQQYVHTVAYLLQGAPNDLSQHEKETIQLALPEQLQPPRQRTEHPSDSKPSYGPSMIHRLLASGIVRIFLLLQLFLPYVRYSFRYLYQFERTNHVSERMLNLGTSALGSVGKMGSDLLGMILRSGNSRVVHLVAAISIWWIQEVSNGIHDGVEGCVDIVDEGKGAERRLKGLE